MTTDDIIRKVAALLKVADGDANENESALALQMAQKLADAHNLDIGVVGKSGARADDTVAKGFYNYQRQMYRDISRLNHCECWVDAQTGRGAKSTTRIIGSKVNVALTKNLCSYIEDVTNRLVRENYASKQFLSRGAHYFREGVIEKMLERVRAKRAAEERAREELKRQEQAKHPQSATAIVLISDVEQAEKKANYDYLHGEGSWDAKEKRIREWDQKRAKADAEFEQWKLDHPEEWAQRQTRQLKTEKKEQQRLRANARARERAREKREQERGWGYSYRAPKESKYDSDDYYNGQCEGEAVSLNEQVDTRRGTGKKLKG